MTAFRRPTNIRDILVRSITPSNNSSEFKPCNTPQCKTCPYTSSTSPFKSSTNGRVFSLNLSCHSYNILYLITCTKCKAKSTSGKQQTLSGPGLLATDLTSTTTETHPWPNILILVITPINMSTSLPLINSQAQTTSAS
ncbi:hypothetical protein ElyMa_001704800 [Elysia marginata]|uniref:LITAF domain-containing protein n=1 Tax=Elysia marginata TaxID=1093978 RepID=A0AAV4JTM0_9GAST|nr:hypothetical protein ElyMa_001704800 [Elysia marginata]